MRWYAETPVRRTRQMVTDLLVVLWVLGWVQVGRWVHGLIAALAAPAGPLRSAGTSLEARMTDVADTITEVPLVGGELGVPFTGAAGVGTDLVSAGDTLQTSVDRLALVAGLLTAGLPIVLVVALWLVLRWRYAVHAARMARERDRPEMSELLALRALVGQPADVLARVHPDPLGAWRRGDPDVVAELVGLELAGSGLRACLRSAGSAAPR